MHKINKKNGIIISIVIICIIVGSSIGVYEYNQYKTNQQIQLEEKQKQEALKKYKKNLVDEMILMLVQEKNLTLITSANSDTWHDAIYNNVDFGDFNQAISDLHQKLKDNGLIDKLDKSEKHIDNWMQKLQNPPGSLINYNKDINDTENDLEELEDKIKTLVPDISK